MKITVEILEALLVRGWSIKGISRRISFRSPDGISGSTFTTYTERLDEFPPAVEEWIWDNIPLTPPGPLKAV